MTDPKGPVNDDVTQILSRPTGQMDRKALLESLRRNVCILFTDLKGSTSYFEKFGDAAGLLMVDRSTKMLSLCVERHKGRVIKTIGDSVMAFWGPPFTLAEDHALLACRAAWGQLAALDVLRRELPELTGLRKDPPAIDLRIGVCTGPSASWHTLWPRLRHYG